MIRDPFDIHRKHSFRATAARWGHESKTKIETKAGQIGVDFSDMAFSIPKHVPNFSDPHRGLEDHAWKSVAGRGGGASGGVLSGVQDRVSSFFDGDSLPMYKDKPYGYPASQRARPWWRRKTVIGGLTSLVFTLLYLGGFFSSSGETTKSTTAGWAWLGSSSEKGKSADWNKRRTRVVEAFELSWDSYERYAWGK